MAEAIPQSCKTVLLLRRKLKGNSLATVNTAAGALVEALVLCLPEGVAASSTSGPEVILLLA